MCSLCTYNWKTLLHKSNTIKEFKRLQYPLESFKFNLKFNHLKFTLLITSILNSSIRVGHFTRTFRGSHISHIITGGKEELFPGLQKHKSHFAKCSPQTEFGN